MQKLSPKPNAVPAPYGTERRLDPGAFSAPPPSYRAMPFWSWNDSITKEGALRQIDEFHNAGVGGFYVHARPGIWTPFLSDEWFELFALCVDRASELGMQVWIYDECSYPSGFAGGLVHDHDPTLAQKMLHCRLVSPADAPHEHTIARFWVLQHAPGRTDYRSASQEGPPPASHAQLIEFFVATHPGIPWLNGRPYIDVLHPKAAAAFLAVAYEPYLRFKEHFGTVIPGVFTDEPHFEPLRSSSPDFLLALPWTPDLPQVYRATFGEELVPRLPELVLDTVHGYRTRVRYWQLLSRLFIERWLRPIYDWCDQHGLLLTGHFWEHALTPDYTGSIMLPTAWQHIPGVDLLGRDSLKDRQKWDLGERGIWNGTPEQMGNVAMIKAVTSVAHQTGRARVMSETYGGAGWDLNFAKQKIIAEWQAALGVNLLVPHLSHYSLRGERKHEHPPSFLGHQPYWDDYPVVHEYLSRLHYALSQGTYEAEVLVLHPMTSVWVGHRASRQPFETIGDPHIVPSHLKERLKLDLDDLVKDLSAEGWSHDMGDELILQDLAAVEGARLRVGAMTYDVVVLPPCVNLLASTVDLLERLLDAGGKVAAVGRMPQFVDGLPDERLSRLLSRIHIFPTARDLLAWLPAVSSRKARIDLSEPGCIYTHVRRLAGGRLVFAVNVGPAAHRDVNVLIQLPDDVQGEPVVERLDLATGTAAALPHAVVDEGEMGPTVQVQLDFAVEESHLLLVRGAPASPVPASAPDGQRAITGTSPTGRHEPRGPVRRRTLGRRWRFERRDPNVLVLARCAYQLEGPDGKATEWSHPLPQPALKRLLRRRYGWPEITFREVQPWRKYAGGPPEPVDELTRLCFRVDLAFDPSPEQQLELVVEEAAEWSVAVNGRPVSPSGDWWIDPAMQRLPVGHVLRRGENVIELACRFREDMSFEPVYLIGDFAVETYDMRTFRLTHEPDTLAAGSWIYQGYPFYAGRMVYRQEVELPAAGRTWLELPYLPAAAARVRINGVYVGTLAWAPLRAELTAHVRTGTNTIEIEVVNSLRNLFGPHYRFEPLALVTPGHWFYDGTASSEMAVVPDGLPGDVYIVQER